MLIGRKIILKNMFDPSFGPGPRKNSASANRISATRVKTPKSKLAKARTTERIEFFASNFIFLIYQRLRC